MYTALIGGGVTLLGVAWTIKQNNDDKKNDIRLQNKPIIYALILNWIQESHYAPIELCLASEKELSTTKIFLKTLVNTDIAIAIVKKVTINDVTFIPETNNVLAKNIPENFLRILSTAQFPKIGRYVSKIQKVTIVGFQNRTNRKLMSLFTENCGCITDKYQKTVSSRQLARASIRKNDSPISPADLQYPSNSRILAIHSGQPSRACKAAQSQKGRSTIPG